MKYVMLGGIYAYTGSLHFLVFACAFTVCDLLSGMIGQNDKALHECIMVLAESIQEIKANMKESY